MRFKKDDQISKLKGLLKVATCPECNGTGTIPQPTGKTWERGDGEEFMVMEPTKCQWCDEVRKAIHEQAVY